MTDGMCLRQPSIFGAGGFRAARLCGLSLLFVAATVSRAWAVVPEVQDGGAFFKPEAITKANDVLAEIGKKHNKDLLIETYAGVPADKVAAVKEMDKEAKAKFFQEWAYSRARRRRVNGVYVLICKDPGHVQIEVGKETQKAAFTIKDRDRLQEILIGAFEKKEHDRGLTEAVEFVQKTLDENQAHTSSRRVK